MFDFSGIAQEHYLRTTAPFTTEFLQQVFTHKGERVAVVDYPNSPLRGKSFLTYLGNINIESDILFEVDGKSTTKEERFELIREYMVSRTLVGCPSLAITVASILTGFKGINEFFANVGNPVLTGPEILEFIELNKVLVNKWVLFFDSTLLFCLSTNWKYTESMGHPMDQYPSIDDPHWVGINYCQLFDVPGFMGIYFTREVDELAWFTKQFDMNNYDLAQQNIFGYFMSAENPLPALVEVMGSEDLSFEDFVESANAYMGLVDKHNNG